MLLTPTTKPSQVYLNTKTLTVYQLMHKDDHNKTLIPVLPLQIIRTLPDYTQYGHVCMTSKTDAFIVASSMTPTPTIYTTLIPPRTVHKRLKGEDKHRYIISATTILTTPTV